MDDERNSCSYCTHKTFWKKKHPTVFPSCPRNLFSKVCSELSLVSPAHSRPRPPPRPNTTMVRKAAPFAAAAATLVLALALALAMSLAAAAPLAEDDDALEILSQLFQGSR